MEVTFYGHSCFQVKISNKTILFDPFITPNELAKSVDISNIKPDYILLSHGHQDHMADVELIYKNSRPTLVASFEITTWFEGKGIEKNHPMNIGGKKEFEFGTVKMVNAIHSSTLPDGSGGGNPTGFVVQSKENTFYYAGDTALHYDMKLIKDQFDLDVAFLPVGDNFTMGIEDAIKAAEFTGVKKIIGMHYDTFPYIVIDHDRAVKLAKDAGIELILMKIGQTINL